MSKISPETINQIRKVYSDYQANHPGNPCIGCIYDPIFNELNQESRPCLICNLGIEKDCPEPEYSSRKVSIFDILDAVPTEEAAQ